MASCLGIACGGNNCFANLGINKRCNLPSARPLLVVTRDQSRSIERNGRIYALAPAAPTTTAMRGLMSRMSLEAYGKRRNGGGNDAVEAHERLDQWMRESVVDIVKNLREAPLLVQVYPKKKRCNVLGGVGGGETTTLRTEKKATVEDWPAVKERWEAGETPLPEGVIFVEELGSDEVENEGKEARERTTKAWGVVVQGKGVGCRPICYLLKTSRVGSGPGTGICSTHFCLMKVKNFRETVESQLKNCWLLQGQ